MLEERIRELHRIEPLPKPIIPWEEREIEVGGHASLLPYILWTKMDGFVEMRSNPHMTASAWNERTHGAEMERDWSYLCALEPGEAHVMRLLGGIHVTRGVRGIVG
jgi:hypothetical protein